MFFISLFGIFGVVASILVTLWLNAENSKDTTKAIGEMASIANSMIEERPLLERQVNAAADSAEAAKTTARLAKGQTNAIVRQADALIGGARATVVSAQAQLVSAQANTLTAQEGAKAASEQLKSATLLAASRTPYAKLSGMNISGWKDNPEKGFVQVKFKLNITNAGGGTLIPIWATFNMMIINALPATVPSGYQRRFGGNDFPVAPGNGYGVVKPFEYDIAKSDISDVDSGKKSILIWGIVDYSDISGNSYKMCYVHTVTPPTSDDEGGAVTPIASPAFQCTSKSEN